MLNDRTKKMIKRKINPTIKQEAAFNNIIVNRGKLGKSMINAGYSPNSALNPKQNLTESEGYQLLLKQSGLTKELVATALANDIKAKPKRRVAELNLGADILGMKKDRSEKDIPPSDLHLHLHQSPRVIQIIREAEEKLLLELTEGEIKNDS